MLSIYARASTFNTNLIQAAKIDGNYIFDLVDEYTMGYISSNMLQKFLKEQCGHLIQENELKLVLGRYDRDKDYRISREEFNF